MVPDGDFYKRQGMELGKIKRERVCNNRRVESLDGKTVELGGSIETSQCEYDRYRESPDDSLELERSEPEQKFDAGLCVEKSGLGVGLAIFERPSAIDHRRYFGVAGQGLELGNVVVESVLYLFGDGNIKIIIILESLVYTGHNL